MRNFSGLPLDDDIIDRVLQFCPTFETLRSAILTSKSFYNVYQAHPRSLLRAVAYNVTGPTLPQALRVVRYRSPEGARNDINGGVANETSGSQTKSDPGNEVPATKSHSDSGSETESDSDEDNEGDGKTPKLVECDEDDEETDEKTPITPEEVHQLCHDAKIVGFFEDLFSLRHKNRRFKTSQLTPTESYRFRRAMYRIMFYSRVFSAEKYEDFSDDDEAPAEELMKVRRARKKFFRSFFSDEILQMYAVSSFLVEMVHWANEVFTLDIEDEESALAIGLEWIYNSMQEDVLHVGEDYELMELSSNPFTQNYLSSSISAILEERNAKLPDRKDSSIWRVVLDSIDGEQDPCDQCKIPTGFDLLGPSTYDFIYASRPHQDNLSYFLKGKLSRVDRSCLYKNSDAARYPKIMETIFNDDIKRPEFSTWKKEDWLCKNCMENYLREHLHLWLLDLKKQEGETIPEDCWYGYNCRTMTHNLQHAQKLNHLCAPSRGT
ncbi:hypothetical protein K435DRAFT_962671 [Dendrothele bispora CBS 962.96]|uniref:Aprataxin and PNK-like factor PBZ domain-containing protein n=1 Tax=Dendrothele bispora (strain CBS 962.96) TaxID=1314807 RepID=A0A4S8MK88_DENBC|nr:hypothetical protein K435DRAFT_962671 [Dendrothele bispora CBS 962.96]